MKPDRPIPAGGVSPTDIELLIRARTLSSGGEWPNEGGERWVPSASGNLSMRVEALPPTQIASHVKLFLKVGTTEPFHHQQGLAETPGAGKLTAPAAILPASEALRNFSKPETGGTIVMTQLVNNLRTFLTARSPRNQNPSVLYPTAWTQLAFAPVPPPICASKSGPLP